MDEGFDTSFETSDTDFSSDIDTNVDYDTSSDISDFDTDDYSYDTLDDIPDDVPDFDTESEDYDTLDDIPEIESDDIDYDTLEDVPDETSIIEEDDNSDIETLADIHEDDLVAESEEPEYETLEDIPDSEDGTVVDEQSIETLADILDEQPTDASYDTKVEESLEEANDIDDDEVEVIDVDENVDENSDDSPRVLKRNLTDEELVARDHDTEETLDNYRENLRDYGVDEEAIEEFINSERDKINAEYESLDNGNPSSNIYHMPTNLEEVANELKNPEVDGKRAENITKDFVDQNVTKAKLPNNGEWSDPSAVGNSAFTISDDAEIKWKKNGNHSCTGAELKHWMDENYGVSSVSYDHKEPDFSPFEDKEIGAIYVDKMSSSRSGKEGTFSLAEQEAMKRLGKNNLEEVKQYMADNELTWHECADGHTIRAVPTRINSAFKHSGGISLERSIESIREVISQQTNGMPLRLQKESTTGTVTGLEQAIRTQHKNFKDTKTKLFKK